MDFEEFKQYLEENKDNSDVQSALKGFTTVSADDVRSFLDTDEGKQLIQPTLDRYHSKSLETWKANNLDSIIEEEVTNRTPQETEEQKRIRKLEEELQNRDKDAKRKDLQNKAFKLAQDKGVPTDLVDYFIGEDEESTSANLDSLKEHFDTTVKAQVESRFKESGRDVQQGDGKGGGTSQSVQDIINDASIRKI